MIGFSGSNIVYTAALLLVLSIGLNVILFFSYSKKENKPKSPLLDNKAIRDFIQEQITETRNNLGKNRKTPIKLDNKVVALRTAYLNVENKALDKTINSNQYWSIIDAGIIRLLKLFLPQVYGKEKQINELENRIELLTQRIGKLQGNASGDNPLEDSIKSINSIIPTIKNNSKAQKIVGNYMQKMESAIDSYENTKDKSEISKKIKASVGAIDKLKVSLTLQNKEAEETKQRISNLIKTREATVNSDEYDEEDEDLIDRLKNAEYQLKEFQNKNAFLEKMIDKLKSKLAKIEKDEPEPSRAKPVFTVNTKNSSEEESDEELDSLSSQVNEIAEREIDRLRSLVKEQDESMSDMSSEMSTLRKKVNENEKLEVFHEETIGNLRKHVKESDSCIKTLEKEIVELNDEIFKEKKKNSHEIDIYKSVDTKKLQNELETIQMELDDSLEKLKNHDQILSYYNESIEASSIEDLAVLIFQSVEDMGCVPNMWLTILGKEIHMSNSQPMPTREKVIINNMKVGETNLGMSGTSLKFRFKNIKGLLFAKDESIIKDQYSDALTFLKYQDTLVDKIFGNKKNTKQLKKIESWTRSITLIAHDVDNTIDTQIKNAKDLMSTSFAQLSEAVKSGKHESDVLRQVDSMERNALAQLSSDEMLKLKIRRQFLEIIKRMDSN